MSRADDSKVSQRPWPRKTIPTRFAHECKPENLRKGTNNSDLRALCDSSDLTSQPRLDNTWCLTVLFGVRYHTGFRRARSLPKRPRNTPGLEQPTRRASVTRCPSLRPGIPAGDVTAAAAPVSVGGAMRNPCAWRAVRRLSTWCCFLVRVLRSRRLPLRLSRAAKELSGKLASALLGECFTRQPVQGHSPRAGGLCWFQKYLRRVLRETGSRGSEQAGVVSGEPGALNVQVRFPSCCRTDQSSDTAGRYTSDMLRADLPRLRAGELAIQATVSISRALPSSETEERRGGRPEREGVRRLDRAFRVRLERSRAELPWPQQSRWRPHHCFLSVGLPWGEMVLASSISMDERSSAVTSFSAVRGGLPSLT